MQLISKELKPRLYGYVREVLENEGTTVIAINGMPDHIHVLLGIKLSASLPQLMRVVKTTSSKWVHLHFPEMKNFAWQDGYGAFSVGLSTLDAVKTYIANQEQHHAKKPFEQEFLEFLRAHHITFDERFVFG